MAWGGNSSRRSRVSTCPHSVADSELNNGTLCRKWSMEADYAPGERAMSTDRPQARSGEMPGALGARSSPAPPARLGF